MCVCTCIYMCVCVCVCNKPLEWKKNTFICESVEGMGKQILIKKSRVRDFPGGSAIKNLSANAVDTSLIPGLGRSQGERNGDPL